MAVQARLLLEPESEEFRLGGLSRAVETFEGDQFAWVSGSVHRPNFALLIGSKPYRGSESYKELRLKGDCRVLASCPDPFATFLTGLLGPYLALRPRARKFWTHKLLMSA